jgi:hypothetical protein
LYRTPAQGRKKGKHDGSGQEFQPRTSKPNIAEGRTQSDEKFAQRRQAAWLFTTGDITKGLTLYKTYNCHNVQHDVNFE